MQNKTDYFKPYPGAQIHKLVRTDSLNPNAKKVLSDYLNQYDPEQAGCLKAAIKDENLIAIKSAFDGYLSVRIDHIQGLEMALTVASGLTIIFDSETVYESLSETDEQKLKC